jgi:hypothetical protein
MKKAILLMLALFLLLPAAFAVNYCNAVPQQYYGFCDTPGDILVYKEDRSLVATQYFSVNSGCHDGIYGITIVGGSNCLLDKGDTIVFTVNGITVGAAVFDATPKSVRMDISDERTYIIIDTDDNIEAVDDSGVDVSKYGSGGGSATIRLVKPTYEGDVKLAVFDANLDANLTIDAGADDYAVFVDLPAPAAEVLVPVNYNTGSVDICLDQTAFSSCRHKLKIALGESKDGISVDAEYRIVDGNRYYVVRGLQKGIVKESGTWLSYIAAIALLVAAVTVLAVYLIIKRK